MHLLERQAKRGRLHSEHVKPNAHEKVGVHTVHLDANVDDVFRWVRNTVVKTISFKIHDMDAKDLTRIHKVLLLG